MLRTELRVLNMLDRCSNHLPISSVSFLTLLLKIFCMLFQNKKTWMEPTANNKSKQRALFKVDDFVKPPIIFLNTLFWQTLTWNNESPSLQMLLWFFLYQPKSKPRLYQIYNLLTLYVKSCVVTHSYSKHLEDRGGTGRTLELELHTGCLCLVDPQFFIIFILIYLFVSFWD